jgi:hypothetical protein
VEITSPEALQTVAKLIQCAEIELGKALTTRTVQMRNEKYLFSMGNFIFCGLFVLDYFKRVGTSTCGGVPLSPPFLPFLDQYARLLCH